METPDTCLPPLRVEYAVSRDEFVRANLHPFRGQRLRGMLLYYVLALSFAGIAWMGKSGPDEWPLLLSAFFVVRATAMPFTVRDTLRTYYRQHPMLAEETVTTLSAEGVRNQTSTSDALIRWHAFTHYAETPELFLLYRGPKYVHYLPKRALGEPGQLEQCRQYLVNFVGRTAIEQHPGFPITVPAIPVTTTATTPPET
jgi:hypothetical protein